MFFNILYSLYSTIIENEITFQKRDSPFQIQNYSGQQVYQELFCETQKGLEVADNLIKSCFKTKSSFILLSYFLNVLENNYTETDFSQQLISSLYTEIANSRISLINNDLQNLSKYVFINVPDEREIVDKATKILQIPSIMFSEKKMELVEQWKAIYEYKRESEPYVQLYYTIKQLKLESVYEYFIPFSKNQIYLN